MAVIEFMGVGILHVTAVIMDTGKLQQVQTPKIVDNGPGGVNPVGVKADTGFTHRQGKIETSPRGQDTIQWATGVRPESRRYLTIHSTVAISATTASRLRRKRRHTS